MSNKTYELDALKGEERNIIQILEDEDIRENGISSGTIEELKAVIGSDLSFVDGIKMLVSAIKNNGVCDTPEGKKEPENKPETVFYDVKAVAKMLMCSIPTAREIMQRKDFPSVRAGKILRVSKDALEAWAMEKRG